MIRATAACASPQHRVIVGIHRDVGVHVAVAGVHVQRHEYAPAKHFAMHVDAALEHRRERDARENLLAAAP